MSGAAGHPPSAASLDGWQPVRTTARRGSIISYPASGSRSRPGGAAILTQKRRTLWLGLPFGIGAALALDELES